MNGRLYDPYLQRFLSPDNYVQSPLNAQNYNRYGYCVNNPLMYNDPDGEWFHIVIGAIIGGFQGYKLGKAAGLKGWNLFWSTVGGAGIGALSAGAAVSVAAGVSSATLATGATAFEASIASGMMTGIVSGAISGAGFTALGGGSFSDIMAGAVQGAVIGGFSGAAGGAAFYGANQLLGKLPMHNTLRACLNFSQIEKWL